MYSSPPAQEDGRWAVGSPGGGGGNGAKDQRESAERMRVSGAHAEGMREAGSGASVTGHDRCHAGEKPALAGGSVARNMNRAYCTLYCIHYCSGAEN